MPKHSEHYDIDRFSESAMLSLDAAMYYAAELGHTYVGTEHYLLGMLHQLPNAAANALQAVGLTEALVYQQIIHTVGKGTPTSLGYRCMTPALHRMFRQAQNLADAAKCRETDTRWLLTAMVRDENCAAAQLLEAMEIPLDALETECFSETSAVQVQKNCPTPKSCPHLFRYGRLLQDVTDPLIGRAEEMERILQILARRSKNNPCLVGDAGVGKTAIAEAVAARFAKGEVPAQLQGFSVMALDLGAMLAGAKYRGDFEERMRACVEEVIRHGGIILFIDELHTLVGAGAAEGAIDAANLLKPALARGEIRLIGATTPSEYLHSIEKDAALARRFQSVEIREPTSAETLAMLEGIRPRYEAFHNVQIPDTVLHACVQLSQKYLTEKQFPDKAIDLMDEACARASMRQTDVPMVLQEDVAAIAAMRTGIPLQQLTAGEQERLLRLETALRSRIVGHDAVIQQLCDAVCRGASGFRDEQRPVGSFLLLGPTGVGKTGLVRALAESLYGTADALLTVDMSEYMEAHAVSKLIGAPPGYAGSGEAPHFCEHLRRHPCSVVLFDEMEKAHPDVLHLLLQMLEDGRVTDSMGRQISLRNCMIFLTSNIGAGKLQGRAGFLPEVPAAEKSLEQLRQKLPPELLNRMDEIFVFSSLKPTDLEEIAARQLAALAERAAQRGVTLLYTDAAVQLVGNCPETAEYGARPIRRFLVQHVETPLAHLWLSGAVHAGDCVEVDVQAGCLQCAVRCPV